MAYALYLNGGTITIPKITLEGDFIITLRATQNSNGRFFFGGDTTAGSLELYRNNAGQVALYIATIGLFSGTTILSNDVNTPDIFVIERISDTITVHVNGILQGTTVFADPVHISHIGWRTGWANLPVAYQLYYLNIEDIFDPANNRFYDPTISNGTGDFLWTTDEILETRGTQSGSWPGDNSEWIYYYLYLPVEFTGTYGTQVFYNGIYEARELIGTYFSGNSLPIVLSVLSGPLPPGITLDPDYGAFMGAPTTNGTYPVKIRATDNLGTTADSNLFNIVVEESLGFDNDSFFAGGFETTQLLPLEYDEAFETTAFSSTGFEMLVLPSNAGVLKVYLTGTWQAKPVKWHNSTSWVTKAFKRWNGTSWI